MITITRPRSRSMPCNRSRIAGRLAPIVLFPKVRLRKYAKRAHAPGSDRRGRRSLRGVATAASALRRARRMRLSGAPVLAPRLADQFLEVMQRVLALGVEAARH